MDIDFAKIRPMFGGKLSQAQVDGINSILAGFARYGDGNVNTLAYILATAKHESGHTMWPVKETQRPAEKSAPSDARVIRRLDRAYASRQLKWVKKPYWRSGWFGRGLVQLTHEFNYSGTIRAAVQKQFGVDIHADRDAVLRMDVSVFILIRGIVEGWFTARGLGKYIDTLDEADAEDLREFIAARATVNGKDRAAEIGRLALGFEQALRAQEGAGAASNDPPVPSPTGASTPLPDADFEPPFAPPRRKPKTLADLFQDWFVQRTIDHLATQAKDAKMLDFLSGYKTYITGLFMVVAAIAQFAGVDLPTLEGQNAGQLLMEAFAIIFLRKAIKTPA